MSALAPRNDEPARELAELRAVLAEAACGALLACCENRGLEVAARGTGLLAELAKDSDEDIRPATRGRVATAACRGR